MNSIFSNLLNVFFSETQFYTKLRTNRKEVIRGEDSHLNQDLLSPRLCLSTNAPGAWREVRVFTDVAGTDFDENWRYRRH